MGVKVWLLIVDMDHLQERVDVDLEKYADFEDRDPMMHGRNAIMNGVTEETGIFSHLKKDFVLGKVNYWEQEGSKHRTPFVRIDNHPCYSDGLVMTPNNSVHIKYNKRGRTIDQTTPLHRVELLSAPNNDFIRRTFVTYELDSLVAKTRGFTRRLLIYCNERHLYNGQVE